MARLLVATWKWSKRSDYTAAIESKARKTAFLSKNTESKTDNIESNDKTIESKDEYSKSNSESST